MLFLIPKNILDNETSSAVKTKAFNDISCKYQIAARAATFTKFGKCLQEFQ